jgi:hypothetical protein
MNTNEVVAERPRVFRNGKFMCAMVGAGGAAALALIREPGGSYERLVARVRAMELLRRQEAAHTS